MNEHAISGGKPTRTLYYAVMLIAGASLLGCEAGVIDAPGSGSLDGLLTAQTPPDEPAAPSRGTGAGTSGRGRPVCTPVSDTDATCDGKDDDCDGLIDENFEDQAVDCCAAPEPEPENKLLYQVTAADSDEFGRGGGGHAFWMPGVAEDYVFEGAGGELLMDLDAGTGSMTGTLVSLSDADDRWEVSLALSVYPVGVDPKLELRDSAYVDRGGPVDPASWEYWSVDAGSVLVGLGGNDGQQLSINAEIPVLPVQIGVGANGKNANLGSSEWISYTDAAGNELGQGDFNVDLSELELPPPPPVDSWTCDDGCSGQGELTCVRGAERNSCDFCVTP